MSSYPNADPFCPVVNKKQLRKEVRADGGVRGGWCCPRPSAPSGIRSPMHGTWPCSIRSRLWLHGHSAAFVYYCRGRRNQAPSGRTAGTTAETTVGMGVGRAAGTGPLVAGARAGGAALAAVAGAVRGGIRRSLQPRRRPRPGPAPQPSLRRPSRPAPPRPRSLQQTPPPRHRPPAARRQYPRRHECPLQSRSPGGGIGGWLWRLACAGAAAEGRAGIPRARVARSGLGKVGSVPAAGTLLRPGHAAHPPPPPPWHLTPAPLHTPTLAEPLRPSRTSTAAPRRSLPPRGRRPRCPCGP